MIWTVFTRTLAWLSRKIYCLQKVNHFKYKQRKHYKSANDSNEFAKIVYSCKRLCELINKKYNKFRKIEYLYWIKIGCSLALKIEA